MSYLADRLAQVFKNQPFVVIDTRGGYRHAAGFAYGQSLHAEPALGGSRITAPDGHVGQGQETLQSPSLFRITIKPAAQADKQFRVKIGGDAAVTVTA